MIVANTLRKKGAIQPTVVWCHNKALEAIKQGQPKEYLGYLQLARIWEKKQ